MTKVKVDALLFLSNVYAMLGKICVRLHFNRLGVFFWKLSFKRVFEALDLAFSRFMALESFKHVDTE